MKAAVAFVLILACGNALAATRELQQAGATSGNSAILTLQFDNSKSEVLNKDKQQAVINALAQHVFLVPARQVTIQGALDQSGIITDQAVVTFKAVGPTTNPPKTVLQNCQENTKESWLGLGQSTAQKEVEKATDTWWPNDSVDIQKATCAAA